MSVLIGHASIDENKKIANGIAGDQTGKEVCIRNWYNGSWAYTLRCKDKIKAEIMAKACEDACNNPYIGYDQNERNTLMKLAKVYNYDLSKINIPCECDCSSLIAVCAEKAGINVYGKTNAPTTTSMKAVYMATGLFEVLNDTKYLNSDKYLMRGDILVNPGHHTIMILGNGKQPEQKGYKIGNTYKLDANMYIREFPKGEKLVKSKLTQNAQMNSYEDPEGKAILRKGTSITCKEVKNLEDSTWIKCPSGWICANEKGKVYIIE